MELGSTSGAGLSTGILTVTLSSLSHTEHYKCVVSRPQVNYYSSELININVKGRDFNQLCLSLEAVAKPVRHFSHAMLISNHHYLFLYKLTVFAVCKHGNICIA